MLEAFGVERIAYALDEVGEPAAAAGAWFHVDGAYGCAALAAPSVRDLFDGIERADSLVVDPHKWLFASFDCAALIYRDPAVARAAHTQHAGYLDPINAGSEWNPTDYGHFLTRRARGLPFWFSLAVHGTEAYTEAVETTLEVARRGADLIEAAPHLDLIMVPTLSVLAFRRIGCSAGEYAAWSEQLMAEGTALVMPTSVDGEPALRLCIVNPRTTVDDLAVVLDTLS